MKKLIKLNYNKVKVESDKMRNKKMEKMEKINEQNNKKKFKIKSMKINIKNMSEANLMNCYFDKIGFK